jgi:predicted dehydrogenase
MNKIKIGILGAARIADWAMVQPCRKVNDVELYAVAARDTQRAKQFAEKYKVPVVHDSYDALLADPLIDAVYVPLPNGYHCEWSMRALDAGKHVLCEKPFASNAQQAELMQQAALRNNRVLLEAFHYRFHPMVQEMNAAVRQLGKISRIETNMCAPIYDKKDIRYDYRLAGGALMDVGAYAIHLLRALADVALDQTLADLPEITEATPILFNEKVDRAMKAAFRWPDGMTGAIHCSMWSSALIKISAHVYGERGELHVLNPFGPHIWNRFKLIVDGKTTTKRVPGAATYTYQLEEFLRQVRRGSPDASALADSVCNMRLIDRIYEKAGLPLR